MVETPPLRETRSDQRILLGSLEDLGARSLPVAFPFAGVNRIRFEGLISGLSGHP